MIKRAMFIVVVVLLISSVASAGVWDWVFGFGIQGQRRNSQQQMAIVGMGQVGVQIGPGSSSGVNSASGSMGQVKTTPSGTGIQGMSFVGAQSTYISTSGRSIGVTAQSASVVTAQRQRF